MTFRKHYLTIALLAGFGLALGACGGGGDATPATDMTEPAPIDVERKAISDAIAAAQTAVAAVNDDAADAAVTAAEMAVAAATAVINGATHISAGEAATSRANLATVQGQLATAKASRTAAMTLASEKKAIADTIAAATTAVGMVMDDSEDATVTAADDAITAATAAIDAAGSISNAEAATARGAVAALQTSLNTAKASRTAAMEEADRRRLAAEAAAKAAEAAETAIGAAMEAVDALSESSTDDEVAAAQALIDAATTAAGNAALDMTQMEGFNARIAAIEEDFDEVGGARRVIETAKTAAMNAATAADTAADTAEAAASAQEANKAHDATSYALAKNAAERARTASDAAAAANTAAQAATTRSEAEAQRDIAQRHQETAEAEQANATKYAGMVQTAKTKADTDAADAKAKAAANKVALTKKAAITAEAAVTEGEGTRPFDGSTAYSDTADSNATANYGVTVKHTGSAVEVTVKDGHADYDAKNDPKFSKTATFGDGQMLVRNDETDREIIVLFTDIEAPTRVRFGATGSGYDFDADLDADSSANDSWIVKTADGKNLGGSRIVGPDEGDTKTLKRWTATGDNAKNVYSGTLDGASGKFRCNQDSGDCIVTTGAKGAHTFSGTLWFTPDSGATVSKADTDYLTYGFWLDATTKNGKITSYDKVQTFATSSLPKDTENLDSITGTATYEGDASGVYFHETKKENGTLDTATSGRFTADVALKAYFDATTLRNANTIAGTISNFDLDGGPDNSWSVSLSASIGSDFALDNGKASGGVQGKDGSLSGQFHSASTPARAATAAPSVLVGEFNADFVNGAVAGAYGARKQP